jgi:regulator of protease activity HflC (stomatin/prohibitin superfamily)
MPPKATYRGDSDRPQLPKFVIPVIVLVVIAVPVLFRVFRTVPAGNVAVATLFGEVRSETYGEGLHVVNPLYDWHLYDARQKTHMETADVPSQDQLATSVDVSVQWRINRESANIIKSDTGTVEDMKTVHLVPKVRSLLREQGKSISRAEDFFQEETQQRLQTNLTSGLKQYLEPKGILIDAVLIRDIRLPQSLRQQIEAKKAAEQQAERAKAELDRKRTESQQVVVEAEARRQAAEEEAEQRRVLADAQAYEIQKINEALANSPGYLQLQAMNALEQIAKDPAAKLYFMNGDSPMPLPLMNIGEPLRAASPPASSESPATARR